MLANAQVSISHSGAWAAALAFPEAHPMAIDIEVFRDAQQAVIRANMTESELDLIAATGVNETMRLTLLWTIKESLSKVLRSGLMAPFAIYAIEEMTEQGDMLVSTFKHFAQYRCLSFAIGHLGVSISFPKRTDVSPNVRRWQLFFNEIIADYQCV
jgi:4'-phosphopantetheinyl transferase EntD